MDTIYTITYSIIALFILISSSITVFYTVKYLKITNLKKKYDWLVLFQGITECFWFLLFGFVLLEQIGVFYYPAFFHFTDAEITSLATVPGSFGTLFIRPVILLSSAASSIWAHIRYAYEKAGRSDIWNLPRK